jgi:NAD(P)-dependent dehydrogenase (short-subunit alcohol dehydrogenase family)
MPQGDLDGRVAIVTGAGSGIGRATAKVLARDGAKLCIADLDAGSAESVVKEIEQAGGEALAFHIDVSDTEQNGAMVAATVERFGGVHAAHLNAGIAVSSTVIDGDVDVWDQVIAVNLRSVYLGLRAIAPAMIAAGGGSIVATASVAGLRGGQGMPSYYASKHGVVGLVKAAAAELAEHGVRVNAVCPGVIDTPILGPAHGVAPITEMLGQIHLLGRVGQPEEVGELVAFLVGPRSEFLTGAAYPVDGGLTAGFAARVQTDLPEGLELSLDSRKQ